MIATGLCTMGGCFAQDVTFAAVETYWPAHSVRIDHKIYILKEYGDDLTLPLLVDGVKLGGRIENVTLLPGDNGGGNFLNWGIWGVTNGVQSNDAVYLGTKYKSQGAFAWFIAGSDELRVGYDNQTDHIGYMEIVASSEEGAFFTSSLGDAYARLCMNRDLYTERRRIFISASKGAFDVVYQRWSNHLVQKRYYLVQPMKTDAGDSAFFIHGYDILAEI